MKKMITVLMTIMMIAGLATAAFAAPGGSRDRESDFRKPERIQHYKYDHRRHISHQAPYQKQVIVVHRTPVRPLERVVYVTHPQMPVFTLFFPTVTIQIR